MDGWVNGWLEERMDELTDGWVTGWTMVVWGGRRGAGGEIAEAHTYIPAAVAVYMSRPAATTSTTATTTPSNINLLLLSYKTNLSTLLVPKSLDTKPLALAGVRCSMWVGWVVVLRISESLRKGRVQIATTW